MNSWKTRNSVRWRLLLVMALIFALAGVWDWNSEKEKRTLARQQALDGLIASKQSQAEQFLRKYLFARERISNAPLFAGPEVLLDKLLIHIDVQTVRGKRFEFSSRLWKEGGLTPIANLDSQYTDRDKPIFLKKILLPNFAKSLRERDAVSMAFWVGPWSQILNAELAELWKIIALQWGALYISFVFMFELLVLRPLPWVVRTSGVNHVAKEMIEPVTSIVGQSEALLARGEGDTKALKKIIREGNKLAVLAAYLRRTNS